MKKILSLYGSPRKGGFSSQLHNEFLNQFSDSFFSVKKIQVYDKKIMPCTACGYCKKKRCCCIDDDMSDIYQDIETADFISISSPLYFSSFPGPLKNLIDRCQLLWEKRFLEDREKKGSAFLISTGGAVYEDMFMPSIKVLRHVLNSIGIDFGEKDSLLVSGTDEFESLPEDIKILAKKKGQEYSAF